MNSAMPKISGRSILALAMFYALRATADQNSPGPSLLDMNIEQLMDLRVASVYGASRYDQKVTQAPSSVSIITAEEIRAYGHRTLVDVLRSVRGLYVSDDRNYSYLGIRGFLRPGDYTTRVLVTIDGHRINDNLFDSGTIGREGMIDVSLIDRVEVIRGPSSSIYGSSAFFGVINVVTKGGSAVDGVRVEGGVGSHDTHEGRLLMGGVLDNGLEWLASSGHYASAGEPRLYYPEFDQRVSADPRARENGIAANMDAEEAWSLFGDLRYGEWRLSTMYNHRYKQVPTAPFGTVFADPRTTTVDDRSYADLRYEHEFSPSLRVLARAFFDNYGYHGSYPYDYAPPGDPSEIVQEKDGVIGRWVGTEWQWTVALTERAKVVFGGEYRENLRELQYSYEDVEPRNYYLNDDRTSRVGGIFAQGEARLASNWILNGGVRFDAYSGGLGSSLNPRVGLIYNASSSSTVKVLYGTAFRAPNPYECFYNVAQSRYAALEPERMRTYELVYERYVGTRYRLSASTYFYDVDGLITQTATSEGDPYFANLGNVRAAGVELEAEATFGRGAHLRASYAVQRAESEDTRRSLSSSPHQLIKLNLRFPLVWPALTAGLEAQYHSSSRTIADTTAGSFLLTNLALSWAQERGFELSVGMNNLLDVRYGYPGAEDHLQSVIQQNGRTAFVKLGYRF